MTKTWVAVAAILMLSSSAMAAEWGESFTELDADGSGSISRAEFNKLSDVIGDATFAPTFNALDENNSNSISKAEWENGASMKEEYGTRFRECDKSWC
ncbi:EF hand [Methyloligella halotolerans]|uniref:EF hand n=1 Tax=Methyloligella halotolerans TaxID=1177755 RepID=A0A1E2RZE0_9HYPH|nr:hypothetical protein [Methyloligella halotolerans]ODA67596.1 EF hand [Methyloligella halotolerans]